MPRSIIRIAPIASTSALAECSPNLMPFHIDYTGKAPISTYMLVDEAKETVGAPFTSAEDGEDWSSETIGLNSVITDAELPKEMKLEPQFAENGDIQLALKNEDVTVTPAPSSETLSTSTHQASESSTSLTSDSTNRFTSAFRGRTIHGLKVDLPTGYVGLVLRGEDNESTTTSRHFEERNGLNKKGKVKATSKGRVTRRSQAKVDEREDAEDSASAMDVDSEQLGEIPEDNEDGAPIRTLVPTSQFSSLVLWHADIPVDEGRDEYYRGLTEWIDLAHEIHQVDSD